MRIRRGSSGEDDDPSWLIREGEGSPDEEEAADPPWLVREGGEGGRSRRLWRWGRAVLDLEMGRRRLRRRHGPGTRTEKKCVWGGNLSTTVRGAGQTPAGTRAMEVDLRACSF